MSFFRSHRPNKKTISDDDGSLVLLLTVRRIVMLLMMIIGATTFQVFLHDSNVIRVSAEQQHQQSSVTVGRRSSKVVDNGFSSTVVDASLKYLTEEELSYNVKEPISRTKDGGLDGHPAITWGKPNTHSVYFDDRTPTNITAVVGLSATLPCRAVNIGRKDVTWIRKRDIHILTVGIFTYTSDDRFKVHHPINSDDWNLEIAPVTFRDAGVYECQVSTSPKISLPVTLSIEAQQAKIPGPRELFVRNGSTINLMCLVSTHTDNVGAVSWLLNGSKLDYDSPRGGVSLEIEKTPEKTTSKLHITRVTKSDSGNYSCSPEFADSTSVLVHVVSEEESAAVQTGSAIGQIPKTFKFLLSASLVTSAWVVCFFGFESPATVYLQQLWL